MGVIRINEKYSVNSLRLVKNVFDDLGIKFWLEGGTLLGAVRDGKILEWDDDIDLAIWNSDKGKLFEALNEFKKRKAKVKSLSTLYPNIGTVKLMFPGSASVRNVMIDIELWKNKDDNITCKFAGPGTWQHKNVIRSLFFYALRVVRHYLCSDIDVYVPDIGKEERPVFERFADTFASFSALLPPSLKIFLLDLMQNKRLDEVNWEYVMPKHYFERLESIKFYGMTVNIPLDAENYLKFHYGETWKVPQEELGLAKR